MALSMYRKLDVLARRLTSLSAVRCRSRNLCSQAENPGNKFDETTLEYLVCPLSKKPLRYDGETNELISESLRVAYPIINGIPNLVPQDGRMMDEKTPAGDEEKS